MVCLLLGLCLTSFTLAEEKADGAVDAARAHEIFVKADAAIKAIDSVRFRSVSTPTGVAVNFAPPSEGTALLVGWNGSMAQSFYSHVKTEKDGEQFELTGGGDGDTYFIIDHRNKTAYEDMDPAVMGSIGGSLQSVAMLEFVHDAPFDKELASEELELLGTEKAAGVECYKIHVDYGDGQQSDWFLSTSDYLPRRVVRHFQFGDLVGSMSQEIYEIEIDPKIDPALFKLKLPEGYQQIDDFAP
jgi:hypothetical protein